MPPFFYLGFFMAKTKKRLSSSQWSEYWKGESITTFKNIFSENYDGEIEQHWKSVFSAIEPGSKIADFACGNGAVALLASKYCRPKNIKIYAVDYATLYPPTQGEFGKLATRVEFLSNVNIEETNFSPDSLDLVVSQFGFEYAESTRVVDELSRVVKAKGGRVELVCHDEHSAIISEATVTLNAVQLCLKSGLTDTSVKLHRSLNKVHSKGGDPRFDRDCEQLRLKINKKVNLLISESEQRSGYKHINYFVEKCMSSFRTGRGFDGALNAIKNLEAEFLKLEERLQDLIHAALSENSIGEILSLMSGKDFKHQRPISLFYGDRLFGTRLSFYR